MALLDFIFAPLSDTVRWVIFLVWLGAIAWIAFRHLIRPLGRSINDIKLARWLERRHPEVQERISTSLELSDSPEGISAELIEVLSTEAATDLSGLDPRVEVSNKRVRKSVIPFATLAAVIALLLAIFPKQMSRLLVRAIAPFSTMGNAEGYRFSFDPGNLEIIEGDEVVLNFSYQGSLDEPLSLFTRNKSGDLLSEELRPVKRDGDRHDFQYRLHGASESFEYFARSGRGESDQFSVKVYPEPTLENATVRYRYPDYTGWPDRVTDFNTGFKALSGTEVVVKARVPTEVKSALFIDGQSEEMNPEISPSASGSDLEFSLVMGEAGVGEGMIRLNHRLRDDVEVARFPIISILDEIPVVKILEPIQRKLRLSPDDQIIINYEVTEQIGIASAEVELEVNGVAQPPLKEAVPERALSDKPNFWNGEAMVYLGSLLDRHEKARKFRLRLKISDNRPEDYDGPGVGYSEWIEVTLDQNAQSLVRQEYKAQETDIRETIDQAIKEIREAQQRMHQAKNYLEKEVIPEHAQKQLSEAQKALAETEKELNKLAERMEKGVQAHRADEIEAAAEKLGEARKNLEFAPLQDTPESRRSEIEEALKNSNEAIEKLQEQRNEIDQDRTRIEDLAKLQELSQKQDALAREVAAESKPDQKWKKKQEAVKDELREMVRQSPQAKAAALEAQAEKANELAEKAAALSESQDDLKDLAKEKPTSEQIADAFKKEQGQLAEEAKEAAAEAFSEAEASEKANEEDNPQEQAALVEKAEQLAVAASKAEEARDASSPQEGSEKAEQAAEKMTENSSLQEKQETVAEGFEALAEGKPDEALEVLEKLQSLKIEEALKEEQSAIVKEAKGELVEARSESAERANTLPEAVAQGEAARDAEEPGQSAEAAQAAAEALAQGEEKSPSQAELQDRQEQLAEAFEALAQGDAGAALAALEEIRAERAAAHAEELQEFPEANDYNQALQQAKNESQDGANRAEKAMKAQANGKAAQATQHHEQSSEQFAKASEALSNAAEQFQAQAAQAAEKQANPNQAPAPGKPLAEAFQKSAEAAAANNVQDAAEAAEAAAQALKSAAQQAKSAMARNEQPGQGRAMAQNQPGQGQPGKDGQPQGDQPGDEPQEGDRKAQGDPGVPPELAKLGLTSKDWEKIKATLKSEIGGARGAVVPEDYRGLVKQYFEQVTKER